MKTSTFCPVAEFENFSPLKAVAATLERHPETIRQWVLIGCRGRQLPAVKIGNQIFVHRQDLAEFLQSLSAK